MPLDADLYKRAAFELERSCGKVCVDGLGEFNRKFAGYGLDVCRASSGVLFLENNRFSFQAGRAREVWKSDSACLSRGRFLQSLFYGLDV